MCRSSSDGGGMQGSSAGKRENAIGLAPFLSHATRTAWHAVDMACPGMGRVARRGIARRREA
eukprot:363348-Chlamydomonas_euryale.AAC.15